MRIQKDTVAGIGVLMLLCAALLFLPANAMAGPRGMILLANDSDGGGESINLTLYQVTVSPIRAYVGDTIYVEALIDNREGGSETSWVEIYANKKKVTSQIFRWGGPGADRKYKVVAAWDTKGMAPGEYTIKTDVFVFNDTSPFDNDMTLREPVILVAPGGEFPGGAEAGGSVSEIDPRYK